MPTPANLVHQTAVSTGTGNFALTKVNGKNDFATAFTTGGASVFDYFICNRDAAEWERGLGHMDTTAALVRDDVLETSAGTTSKIDFSAGTKDVTNDIPALSQVRATTVASSGALAVLDTTAGNLLKGASLIATTAVLRPSSNDGVALGTTAQSFSDLFLASGGVINFANGNMTVTHATTILTVAGGALKADSLYDSTFRIGRVLLTSGTVSNAATLDIVLTSYTAYRAIAIVLTGARPATDGTHLYMRTSTDGGSSYDAGAGNYQYAFNETYIDGVNYPNVSASATEIKITNNNGNAAAESTDIEITLWNQTAAFNTQVSWHGAKLDTSANTSSVTGAGQRLSAADVDAIRFLFSSGNIAEAKYAVYGLL